MSIRDIIGRGPRVVATDVRGTDSSLQASPPASPNSPDGAVAERTGKVTPRWLIFGIVSMALMMGSIDQTIVSTALQTLHKSLHAPINWAGWTITAYQLGAVLTLPTAGRISDLYGRKRVFLICVVLFTLSSLACGLASNIYMLVPLRALQAVGGGAFMPCAVGIVSETFGKDRDRAIGMFTSIFPLGALIGPTLGGIIIAYWSWRGIFLINVPIGGLLLLLGFKFLPHSAPKTTSRPDFVGVALFGGMLVSAMYGITSLGSARIGVTSPTFYLSESVAAVFAIAFGRHTSKVETPIIPIHLLRHRTFATMNVIALIYGGCALGFGALVPLYAQTRYHIDPLQSGTLLTARAIGSITVAGITSFMLRRIGYRLPMLVGFSGAAAGLLMLSFAPHLLSAYAWLAVGAMIMGLGTGISAPATNNATLSLAPDQVAAISGLRGMFRQIGGMITIAVTTVFVARSANQGIELSHAILVFAFLIGCVAIPLVLTVPNRKGTW